MTTKAILSILLLLPTLTAAATIRVPDDFPTIASALGAAVVGDIVEVACGTYYEHDLVLPPGVMLRSQTGEASCVTIDAGQTSRVMSCTGSTAGTAIEGLTITGGRPWNLSGAGLYVDHATLSVARCRFVENFCAGGPIAGAGGGIGAIASSLTVTDCFFQGNRASSGGGLSAGSSSSVSIASSTFLGNIAYGSSYGGGSGGGIQMSQSTLTVSGCVIESNSAASSHSSSGGGGIETGQSFVDIVDCSFVGNHGGDGGTGALQMFSGDAQVSHCLFARNRAEGAFSSADAISLAYMSGTISNCTIVRNGVPPFVHSAVSCREASPSLSQCLIAFNLGWGFGGVGAVSLSCTDIFGNSVDWGPNIADQQHVNGNFSLDPLFCDLENDDFHLQWGSPCLPANSSGCDLVGALGFGGCGSVAVEPESWAGIKGRYR